MLMLMLIMLILMLIMMMMLMLEQMEPVMVEVQRPSREEPRVEGRMVKVRFFQIMKYCPISFFSSIMEQ